MAEPRRWFDPSQPQTLQMAVMLCYVTAAFGLLFVLFGQFPVLVQLALGIAAYGVANEKRWGYWLGVVLSILNTLLYLSLLVATHALSIVVSMAFMVALVALFLHPQSREYQRIWFR